MIGIIASTVKPVISKKLDGDTQNIGLEVLHKYNPYKRVIFC